MVKYKVLSPVIQGGVIVASGEIDLSEDQVERLVELGAIEAHKPAKESDSDQEPQEEDNEPKKRKPRQKKGDEAVEESD